MATLTQLLRQRNIRKQKELAELSAMPSTTVETAPPASNYSILNPQQREAVHKAIHYQYSNLIGYAGTGKTFTVQEIITQLIAENKIKPIKETSRSDEHLSLPFDGYNFAFCAFTGKAVENIQQNVSEEFINNCYTIHKLIDYGPELTLLPATKADVDKGRAFNTGDEIEKLIFVPRKDRTNKLDLDFVLIDEVSMTGLNLLKQLLAALPDHTRIVAVGDLAQLPPVLDKSSQPLLLHRWPTTELTQIYRQKDGDLISNAHAIRNREMPVASDIFTPYLIDKENEEVASRQIMNIVKDEVAAGNYSPMEDIFLTPFNTQVLGQEMLNIQTRRLLNPKVKPSYVKTMRNSFTFAIGDRVLNETNDNDMGIFNGMLGTIISIKRNAKVKQEFLSEDGGFNFNAALDDLKESQQTARDKSREAIAQGYTELADEDEDEKGTGRRLASHSIDIVFDKDWRTFVQTHDREPDATEQAVISTTLYTSSQIEKLKLGWWITIHKSQGSGFRNVYLVLHDTMAVQLSNELLYTAVTRTKEKFKLFCTKYAFGKALKNQRIKGDTLEDKINSYCETYEDTKETWDLIPVNETGD